MRSVKRGIVVALVAALAFATAAMAGVVVEERPVALVTDNLVMHAGKPFVRLADLARALGGHGTWNAAKLRHEIQPGPNGVLKLNAGPLSALGPGGDPEHHLKGHAANQNAFKLGIGGQDVGIEEEDKILLRPADPAISLDALARLLGGRARIDTTKGTWVLPLGGPGTPLQFR